MGRQNGPIQGLTRHRRYGETLELLAGRQNGAQRF